MNLPRHTSASPRRCVLLFARDDAAEARAKGLGARGAAVFSLLRARVARAVSTLGVDLVVAGAPGRLRPTHVLAQRGLDFGARFAAAFEDTRALGYAQVVAVGLDTPRLGPTHLRAAFEALERNEVVVGPSADGGVYLLGCAGADLSALSRVRWLGRHVAEDLRAAFGPVHRLERLADIDRAADARRAARGDSALARLLEPGGAPGFGPAQTSGARRPSPSPPIRGPPAA